LSSHHFNFIFIANQCSAVTKISTQVAICHPVIVLEKSETLKITSIIRSYHQGSCINNK